MTQLGVILGTAAYMSPEQAKGRQADKRSDVWAFGAVLFEMLSGQRAFKGDDISDTLAAVLRQDVDWTALPASTPASVRRLIARCLDRDVRRRLRDIGEARIVLEDPAASAEEDAGTAPAARAAAAACGDARFPSRSPRSWPAHWPEPPRGTCNAHPHCRWLSRAFPFTLPEGQAFTAPGRASLDCSVAGRHADGVCARTAGSISGRCPSSTCMRFKAPRAIRP